MTLPDDFPPSYDAVGSPFAQAVRQLGALEDDQMRREQGDMPATAKEMKIDAWFAWLAAQSLIRGDKDLQGRVWACWGQLKANNATPAFEPIQGVFGQLEAVGGLDRYGGEALHLLQQTCTAASGDTKAEQMEPFVRALVSLVDRPWWERLRARTRLRTQAWDGQEDHLPQRIGEMLCQYMHEYKIGGSFRPALVLNILRDFAVDPAEDNGAYRKFVAKVLEGGTEEFVPAGVLPLLVRMTSVFRDGMDPEKEAAKRWTHQLMVQRFLDEKPDDVDLFFSPTGDTTWENICAAQIKQDNIERCMYEAWDLQWSTAAEYPPGPTMDDAADHLLACQADEILALAGAEAVDCVPQGRRAWLLDRLESIQVATDNRRGRATDSATMKRDTPALRATVERARLRRAAGADEGGRSPMGLGEAAPTTRRGLQHKM